MSHSVVLLEKGGAMLPDAADGVKTARVPRAGRNGHGSLHQHAPLVRLEHGDLLFTAADGAEWHVVDAMRSDARVTILSPGSPDSAYRIFKPAAGPSLVYVFAHDDDRSARSDFFESQLAKAVVGDGQ
jgi:hypothetical protein